jgi:hypothetical protein
MKETLQSIQLSASYEPRINATTRVATSRSKLQIERQVLGALS